MCWLSVSACVAPGISHSSCWCLSSRQAKQEQAGGTGTGAEGLVGQGMRKGKFGGIAGLGVWRTWAGKQQELK